MYHGPVEQTLKYFGSLGFRCPERKGTADFLQEVVSKKDQKVRLHVCMLAFHVNRLCLVLSLQQQCMCQVI